MSKNIKRLSGFLLFVMVIALPLIVWSQRWYIHDTLRLRGYEPPEEIQKLASDTTLNESTKRLFYVYYPSLNDKQDFNNNCKFGEKTIILGCYVSGEGIYIFNVTDARLNGIVQVTAAHETLHAAYERLNSDERKQIDNLTQEVFKSLNNPRIAESIAEYQKNGANVSNELHSIIGTEVRELPEELEKYYSKYFDNRLKIVEYSEKYEKEFTERKQKVEVYDTLLADLKNQVETKEGEINNRKQSLVSERARLDSLLAAKDFETYNAGVSKYNSSINSYNKLVRDIRSLIDYFNNTVAERNAIVSEETELINAIDSRPDTLPVE